MRIALLVLLTSCASGQTKTNETPENTRIISEIKVYADQVSKLLEESTKQMSEALNKAEETHVYR